ncbi:MAG: hypothetical protein WD225_05340 [Ilumatobacteraceae bacterium]
MPLLPAAAVSVLKRRALRDGIFGQSTAWRVVAVVAFGAPLVRRLVAKRPDVVLIEELLPGESMQITPIAPTSRRSRRRSG